jgi:hypothetical protein
LAHQIVQLGHPPLGGVLGQHPLSRRGGHGALRLGAVDRVGRFA